MRFTFLKPLNKSLDAQLRHSRHRFGTWPFFLLERLATATKAEGVVALFLSTPGLGVRAELSYARPMALSI